MVVVGDGRYEIPEDFAYTIQHVYINPENGRIGLNELGIDFIGKPLDLDFLKEDKVEKGKPFASIELEHGMVTLKSPVSGDIKDLNPDAIKYWPNAVYKKGYFMTIIPSNLEADLEDLIRGEKIKEWARKEAVFWALPFFAEPFSFYITFKYD